MERYVAVSEVPLMRMKRGQLTNGKDIVAEEVPVALSYNGISHAVMLATPADLEDFAVGFSMTEGIVQSPKDIYSIDVIETFNGIHIEIEIASECFVHLKERRRNLTGRTGCGLCGSAENGKRYSRGFYSSFHDQPSERRNRKIIPNHGRM